MKEKLTPPDPNQCQSFIHNGAGPFTFGGVPKMIRCGNVPIVIVTEVKPNKEDGKKGSMSLCLTCWKKLCELMGSNYATATPII